MKWLVVLETRLNGEIEMELIQGEIVAIHDSYIDYETMNGYNICVVETMGDEKPIYKDFEGIRWIAFEYDEYKMPKHGRLNSVGSYRWMTADEKLDMADLIDKYDGCVDECESNGRYCRDRIIMWKDDL